MRLKITLLTHILLITAFLITACGQATQPPPPPAPATQAASAGFDWKRYSGEEITLLLNEHPWTDGVRPYVKEFEDLTGIKVNLQAFAEDLYFDKMELAVRSDKPVADVYYLPMDSDGYVQYLAGLITPLTPMINDPTMTSPDYDVADFPEGFRLSATYPPGDANAQLYGIPITFEAYILFYNKDLVNKFLDGKVPETMPELLAAAQKITAEGGGEVFGSVVRGVRSDTIMDTVNGVVVNSWGSDPTPLPYNVWFDGDWANPRFTDPRITEGLSNYAGLMKYGPPNVQSMDWNDANQLFAQGKAAFYVDASLFGPGFEDPAISTVAGKVGYAPLPKTEKGEMTGHWLWGLAIPKNSQHKEAAWYFIQWATNKDNEPKIGTKTGGAPRLTTWDNSIYTSGLNADYVKAVQTAMATSRSTAVFYENWKEVAIMIIDSMHEMYSGKDPALATQDLQNKVLSLTKQ